MLLAQLADEPGDMVLSTGGGVVLRPGIWSWMGFAMIVKGSCRWLRGARAGLESGFAESPDF